MQEQDAIPTPTFTEECLISVTVNGRRYEQHVPVRLLLSDFLRHELHLTGTHVGCEHGVCGCCTVLLNGEAVRSCLMLAVQTDGWLLLPSREWLALTVSYIQFSKLFAKNTVCNVAFARPV